uniref:Uncharacterized protein n=1 Tax=Anguilla anguilla TaxID=7936 RepID=A0A0E9RRZ9_ANGAN
MVIPKLAM